MGDFLAAIPWDQIMIQTVNGIVTVGTIRGYASSTDRPLRAGEQRALPITGLSSTASHALAGAVIAEAEGLARPADFRSIVPLDGLRRSAHSARRTRRTPTGLHEGLARSAATHRDGPSGRRTWQCAACGATQPAATAVIPLPRRLQRRPPCPQAAAKGSSGP